MRRETQNVLLVLLGGALCKLVLSGALTRYVKPSMGPFLLTAGALTVLLGTIAIAADIRVSRRQSTVADDGHEHNHGSRSPWLLVLPVLAVFLVVPPALGADSVQRAQPREPVATAGFRPLPPGAVLPMSLSDFVTRSAYDGSNALGSRSVRLAGFVAGQGGQTYLARLVITCCAADAMPLKVRLVSADLGGLRADDWVEVTGRLVPGTADPEGDFVPDLRVGATHRIEEPSDPYEH